MYTVVRPFFDAQDKEHFYRVGDEYPRAGKKATKARVNALMTGQNKNGKVYIEEVAEPGNEE